MALADAAPTAAPAFAPPRPPPLRELFAARPVDAPLAAPAPPWRSALVSLLVHAAILLPLAFLVRGAAGPSRLDMLTIEADVDVPHDLFDAPGEDADARVLTVEKLERPPLEDAAAPKAPPKPDELRSLGAELAAAVRAQVGAGAQASGAAGNAGGVGGAGQGSGDGVAFAKLSAKGRRFVFCIDRSASMNEHDAIEFAKKELADSVDKLQPHMEFQVVFYNEEAKALDVGGSRRRKDLMVASGPNRQRAINAIKDTVAGGGTNHQAALALALELRPEVIFLMTDAEDDPREIQRLIVWYGGQTRRQQALNEAPSVHVVQYWHDANKPPQEAIRNLAALHHGSYRLIEAAKLLVEPSP